MVTQYILTLLEGRGYCDITGYYDITGYCDITAIQWPTTSTTTPYKGGKAEVPLNGLPAIPLGGMLADFFIDGNNSNFIKANEALNRSANTKLQGS